MADTGQSLRQGRWETSGMEMFPMCAQQGQRDASQASRGWLEWQPRVGGGRWEAHPPPGLQHIREFSPFSRVQPLLTTRTAARTL